MSAKLDYGAHEAEMAQYLREGETRALRLDNRGPLRFSPDGTLHPDITDAYRAHGFYVLEGLLGTEELDDLKASFAGIRDRLPAKRGAAVDVQGRPAIGVHCEAPTLFWSKPLGDPFGGTDLANGRHPVKMVEPTPEEDAPAEIVYLIHGSFQFSDACLRLYGHPQLLAVAAYLNGDDFVPFTDAIFIKEPGRGASFAWHQDGTTHWKHPQWTPDIHGFNFMAQLFDSTAANGVWTIPGSHNLGKIDIEQRVAQAGSERLPDALPMLAGPGDVIISNRQLLHCSFANTSPDWRVTLNVGFHPRASVLGVRGGGVHNAPALYDADRINRRSRVIGYAIDARRQRFPNEDPFVYRPFVERAESWRWDEQARADLVDYNLLDLSI